MFKQLASGFVLAASIVCQSSAVASVSAVALADFPAGPVINFTGLADGTEVNGLSLDGVLFSYSLGDEQLIINGGPGITNNLTPPNVVTSGSNTGTLTLKLPRPAMAIGFGYALLTGEIIADATTITLFDGAINVGSLSFEGAPDPSFAGGFAGIQSTIAFDRVELVFHSTGVPAFAMDNIRLPDPPPVNPCLDLDGDGTLDALTDGLMLMRAQFGLTGDSVTNGAIGTPAPPRATWAAIRSFMNSNCGTSFAH